MSCVFCFVRLDLFHCLKVYKYAKHEVTRIPVKTSCLFNGLKLTSVLLLLILKLSGFKICTACGRVAEIRLDDERHESPGHVDSVTRISRWRPAQQD